MRALRCGVMRITPGDGGTWSYQSIGGHDYLGLNLTFDNGKRYFFKTNFKVEHLALFPEYGAPFSARDNELLAEYIEGLSAVGVSNQVACSNVSVNFELALNAVACYRFVRSPKRAITQAFLPYCGAEYAIKRGMVATLYARDHRSSDYIVLDSADEAQDGIFRLMFVNRDYRIGNCVLSVGAVIKVPRSVICPFRWESQKHPSSHYA